MTEHAYDAPDLSPKDFLLAVMHDESVPMSLRLKAAHTVAPYVYTPVLPKEPPVLTIRIGGIPNLYGDDLDKLLSMKPTLCIKCGHYMPVPCVPKQEQDLDLECSPVSGHA
jgi:hypothetical protein